MAKFFGWLLLRRLAPAFLAGVAAIPLLMPAPAQAWGARAGFGFGPRPFFAPRVVFARRPFLAPRPFFAPRVFFARRAFFAPRPFFRARVFFVP